MRNSLVKNIDSLAMAMEMGRGRGKTFQLALACKNIGATLICANHVQARLYKKQYGVPTTTIECQKLRGTTGPYLIDNFAVTAICDSASSEINRLNKRIKELTERLKHDKIK